jgi:DNA-binding phage protein
MRLKDFHETFSNDLQDCEFVLGYLQESLEEGGIVLFISALKDVVKVYQSDHDYFNKTNDEQNILNNFLQHQNPTLVEVYKVLKTLDLDLQRFSHSSIGFKPMDE